MNTFLMMAIIIGITIICTIIFLSIRKIRLKRLKKERNYHIIESRFKKKNRSSEGSPY